MKEVSLAFTPCPNDTFVFHAMLFGCVDTRGMKFVPHLHDVETLNGNAFDRRFQVTKLSFFAYLKLKDRYDVLDAGAALGYGCGPLLVARTSNVSLKDARVAVPGEHTTANMLVKLWNPQIRNVEMTSFEQILPGVQSGKYDAGVIIHEGRFVYPQYGCVKIVDLGEWWEAETGLPIPLGCIAVRKDAATLGMKRDIEGILRDSVRYAFANPGASKEYVKAHAQEMDDQVVDAHIALYVNDFSLSLGPLGEKAVQCVEEMARRRGIL